MSAQPPIWELPDEDEAIEGLDEYGDPDPAYAAALGLRPAPVGRRALAGVLDIALYCLLQVPYWVFALPLVYRLLTGRISWYGFVNHPDFILAIVMASITAVLSLAFVVVQLALLGRSGLTFGKAVTGLRAVNVKTLVKPGFWRVTLRALVLWGSAVVVVGPVLFLLSPLFDPQRRGRGWHDVVGQTWLVDVRHGLHPYDKKRLRVARKTVTAAPAPQAKSLPSLATASEADPRAEYRPAGRSSAGVLGAARPHGTGERPSIGLTGLEPATPQPAQDEDDPGHPVVGGYLASRPPSSPASAPEAPEVEPEPQYAVRLDNGERLDIEGVVVLGRMPAEVEGARAVAVADETLSVSKTHVELRPTAEGLEVVDRGSTNGTAIVHDAAERALPAGEVGLATPGDTIRFGDRSATVVRA